MNEIQQFLSRFILKLMKLSLINRGFVYLVDIILCMVGFSIAVFNRMYITGGEGVPHYEWLGLIFLAFCGISLAMLRSHRGLNRHANIQDMWRPFIAIMLASMLLYLVMVLFVKDMHGRLTFTENVFLFSLIAMFFVRFWIVIIYNYAMKPLTRIMRNTLIYGTGTHSIALAQWVQQSKINNFKVIGFLSNNPDLYKSRIQSLTVYPVETDSLDYFISRNEVSVIIFPDYQTVRKEQTFISRCREKGVTVVVSPPFEGVSDKGEAQFHIRNIQFEDLLGRDEIRINMDVIASQLTGKVLLITGAAGSIGSEIVRQLAQFKPSMLVLFDVAETPLHNLRLEMERSYPQQAFVPVIGDVRSLDRLEHVFKKFKPEVIYHAAAYKHVPLMEENPCEAVLVNVGGTKNVADMAVKYGAAAFVMVSTDKAVNPTNIMGTSKRIAEIYVQSLANVEKEKGSAIRFVTTRFGNVLGSNGSVIPHFKAQIEKGGPVTVTHPDIIRYFMTIPEACRLVLEAASFGNTGEIYVFDMGEPVKIVDLARKMIELAGLVPDKDIQIEYIGLRPGEKLYEELLNDKETALPTNHEKINIAQVRRYQFLEVESAIQVLVESSRKVDIETTVRNMKVLVPEFKSKNSPFERFDVVSPESLSVSACENV